MKKTILLFFFLIVFVSGFRAQGWKWMRSEGYNDNSYSDCRLSKSPSGNLLISCISDAGSSAKTDLILCTATGDTLWKKHFLNLIIEDVSFDPEDNIYFSGSFI